jgi:hypothetical protein
MTSALWLSLQIIADGTANNVALRLAVVIEHLRCASRTRDHDSSSVSIDGGGLWFERARSSETLFSQFDSLFLEASSQICMKLLENSIVNIGVTNRGQLST